MSWLGNKVPDAILETGIIVWIVGRCYSTHWRDDFVLATAFLAVVSIFVKREAVMTRTLIRAYCVSALVLATAVVVWAFVHVREENSGETGFLNTVIAQSKGQKKIRLNRKIRHLGNVVYYFTKYYLLSDVKVTLKEFPSEIISDGSLEPQKIPCFLKRSSPSLLLTSTESYSQSCWRALFPSKSKCVKFSVIRYWGGAIISQTQSLFPG